MNLELARSVVDAIARPAFQHAIALEQFSERDWRRSYHWLITSGLALHLLATVKEHQAEALLPHDIEERLGTLDRASAIRTDALRRDFLALNHRFQALGAAYANWKGFSLEPDFCADVRLRPQMDFDFIVQPTDAELFDSVLRDCGYERTRDTPIEATYEILPGHLYSLEQVYHAKPHRKVELHFAVDHGSRVTRGMDLRGALERRCPVSVAGQLVPVLTREDAFLSHAAHAGRHALEGWVRLGWLHEIDYFCRRHANDAAFWNNVRCLAEQSADLVTSAAVAILLAARVWRRELPDALGWAEEALPGGAVRWIELHGDRLAMADFPGTKLNLLLQRELIGTAGWREVERAALFRRRRVPRVAHVPGNPTFRQWKRAFQVQLRFSCRRMFFHVIEIVRYFFLKWRWSRPSSLRVTAGRSCNGPVRAHSNSLDG